MKERTARGTAIVNLVALGPDEHIEAVIDTRTYEDGAYLFFATRNGMVKKTRMSEYDSSLRSGLIAINLNDGDELVKVVQTSGDDDILMVSRNGMSIRFTENDVRAMGRATAGVRGMKLKNAEDAVVSFDVVRDDTVMLFVSSSGHGKRTRLEHFHRQGRGGQGVRGMKITASRGSVVAAFTVAPDDEILVFSSGGNLIRMGVKEISSQGRDATGVRVARLGARGDRERSRAGARSRRRRGTTRRWVVLPTTSVLRRRRVPSAHPWPPVRGADEVEAAPRPVPSPAKARVQQREPVPVPSTERRYRQTIARVDLWSVLKVSVCFYICSMAVVMVALVALWVIGDAAGVISNVEQFLGDLLQTNDFTFLDGEILRGALLVAAVLVVLLIVITVIGAAFYNLFAEIFGGVEVTITEDESAI